MAKMGYISTRRLIETFIDQLTERFAINAIRVKGFWYLQSRIARKSLALARTTTLAPTTLDALVQI